MNTFENHQEFNRHMSIEGFRVNTSGTTPSLYITEVKLKRAIREVKNTDLEEILDRHLSEVGLGVSREKLIKKLEFMQDWQLLIALNILLLEGNYEAVRYLYSCKRTDKEIN